MRISDWSSDVCSSDLALVAPSNGFVSRFDCGFEAANKYFGFTGSQGNVPGIRRITDPQAKAFGQPTVRLRLDPGQDWLCPTLIPLTPAKKLLVLLKKPVAAASSPGAFRLGGTRVGKTRVRSGMTLWVAV